MHPPTPSRATPAPAFHELIGDSLFESDEVDVSSEARGVGVAGWLGWAGMVLHGVRRREGALLLFWGEGGGCEGGSGVVAFVALLSCGWNKGVIMLFAGLGLTSRAVDWPS